MEALQSLAYLASGDCSLMKSSTLLNESEKMGKVLERPTWKAILLAAWYTCYRRDYADVQRQGIPYILDFTSAA